MLYSNFLFDFGKYYECKEVKGNWLLLQMNARLCNAVELNLIS